MTEIEKPVDSNLETEATAKAFLETYTLFKDKAYKGGEPLMCEIHEAFGGLEGKSHNCLGCNFSDSTDQIKILLELYQTKTEIKNSFPLFILSLYLLVERMESIMNIVALPEKFREKHFKVFQQIRKWANFVKHPKSFILVHHPTFNFENSGFEFDDPFDITIDEQFVQKYYKGHKNPEDQKKMNKELYEKLHNKQNVIVIFPDIVKLTDKLCYSINKFVEIILNNEVYREILHDEATIEQYFEEQQNSESET